MESRVHSADRAISDLLSAMDAHDPGSARHCLAVGRFADVTARRLGLNDERVRRIRLAGVLHDVGKTVVPEEVLHEPGPLDEAGWREIRRHPEAGARILREAGLDDVADWVLAHHERLDGDGYPHARAADDIPLEARILAVVDAYEAMTADRVYRPAMGHDEAEAELWRCAGTQFDRDVVEAFTQALAPLRALADA
jgi:putative nucleotidyltransferase with HDIG domain